MELFVEGFVALESVDPAADYYYREPTRSIAPGRRSRVPGAPGFRLGDRLRVRVDRIDRLQKRIHFSVVGPPAPTECRPAWAFWPSQRLALGGQAHYGGSQPRRC